MTDLDEAHRISKAIAKLRARKAAAIDKLHVACDAKIAAELKSASGEVLTILRISGVLPECFALPAEAAAEIPAWAAETPEPVAVVEVDRATGTVRKRGV